MTILDWCHCGRRGKRNMGDCRANVEIFSRTWGVMCHWKEGKLSLIREHQFILDLEFGEAFWSRTLPAKNEPHWYQDFKFVTQRSGRVPTYLEFAVGLVTANAPTGWCWRGRSFGVAER